MMYLNSPVPPAAPLLFSILIRVDQKLVPSYVKPPPELSRVIYRVGDHPNPDDPNVSPFLSPRTPRVSVFLLKFVVCPCMLTRNQILMNVSATAVHGVRYWG